MRIILITLLIVFSIPLSARTKTAVYPIVIDPGHGGATNRRKDDRWDPISQKYISYVNYGSQYKNYHEHELVLGLAKRVKYYLDLTNSKWGWLRFKRYLAKFAIRPKGSADKAKFKRIRFMTYLSRKDSWEERGLKKTHPEVNAPYRMFDYLYGKYKRKGLGKISRINQRKPYLVLSLHMMSAGRGNEGGMVAILTPGYKTLNLLRQISLGKKPPSQFYSLPWQSYWLVDKPGWSRFQSAYSDAWVYFHGYGTQKDKLRTGNKKLYRGIRHNLVTWRYADPPGWEYLARKGEPAYTPKHRHFRPQGVFWDRERSQAEQWRREGGRLRFGGDNYYATDELLRYIQYGVQLLVPNQKKSKLLGPIRPPIVSTYALPIYTNAITAYLEVGFINRARDRRLVIKKRNQVAISLAIGIYSLFAGLELKPSPSKIRPQGKPIHWQRYEKLKEGNYFQRVVK